MKKWKIGVIYSNGYHGIHQAFAGLPNVEIILASPDTVESARAMKLVGATRRYDNFREMFESESPDVVVICSRLPSEHFPIICAAIERGIHVFCEKPLTDSLAEADFIAALAKRLGVKVAVAHIARHAHVFRIMKQMIDQGEIGRPLTFYGRGKEDRRGGGEDLMVLGTHILDLGVYLFGMPQSVYANVAVNGHLISPNETLTPTEPLRLCAGDSVWASFRFADGVQGLFESRKGLCAGVPRMGITVVGTTGALAVRYDAKRDLRICRDFAVPEDDARFEPVELPPDDRQVPPLTAPLDYENYAASPSSYFAPANRFAALDLLRSIDEDRQPLSSVDDAVCTLEMIYGIYASSISQRAVSFPLLNRESPLK